MIIKLIISMVVIIIMTIMIIMSIMIIILLIFILIPNILIYQLMSNIFGLISELCEASRYIMKLMLI